LNAVNEAQCGQFGRDFQQLEQIADGCAVFDFDVASAAGVVRRQVFLQYIAS